MVSLQSLIFPAGEQAGDSDSQAQAGQRPQRQACYVYHGDAFHLLALLHEYGRRPVPDETAKGKADGQRL